MKTCKISIIVPNYNHSKYLEQRLESIFNQTLQDFEVIILDDCSTDNSIEILSQFKNHEKVSYYKFNEANSGSPFKQWEKGIEKAKGEYIWIAESDDFAGEEFLQVMIKHFEKNPLIGLAYCQSYVINEEDEVLFKNTKYTEDLDEVRWESSYTNNGVDECKKYLFFKNTIPNASAVLFKKSLVNTQPTSYRLIGDWVFWINILKKSNIYYEARPMNYFRRTSHSTRIHDNHEKVLLRVQEGIRMNKHFEDLMDSKLIESKNLKLYFKFIRSLPLRSLLFNTLFPYNSFEYKFKYKQMALLTIREILSRAKKKISIVLTLE